MDGLETIAFTEEGDIATVTLNRPSVGNRINVAFLREFQRVCEYLEDHSQSRIVVLRGAGDDFCMGIDFGDFNPQQPIDIHGFAKWEKMVVLLERLPKVTIALLHGRVVGAGMQLALACDQRIALEGTVFQIPEVHMGFLPGMAVFRLAKYIGLGHVKRLLLTAEEWHASSALEWGIVDRIAADLQEGLNARVASL